MKQDTEIKKCKTHGVDYVKVLLENGNVVSCMRCHLSKK